MYRIEGSREIPAAAHGGFGGGGGLGGRLGGGGEGDGGGGDGGGGKGGDGLGGGLCSYITRKGGLLGTIDRIEGCQMIKHCCSHSGHS